MTISATVLTDSVSTAGDRLTTFRLYYPRFIHAEFMTHRDFSRNAASNRAIPTKRLLQMIREDTAIPERFGVNKPGMQDGGEMSPFAVKRHRDNWLRARDAAIGIAERMIADDEQPHKQVVNRILEPFMHITVLVSSTRWANFFALRDHADADPSFAVLAARMLEAYNNSKPTLMEPGEWHLPYVLPDDVDAALKYTIGTSPEGMHDVQAVMDHVVDNLCRISTARCARVSYLNHESVPPSIVEDLSLCERLIGGNPKHASPAEHQATPDPENKSAILHGNFDGWIQHRKYWIGERVVDKKYRVG